MTDHDPFKGFESPNYTMLPNEFFDDLLKDIKELSELKVTLTALRETFGYHRPEAELAQGYFVKATGMERDRVRSGLKLALERGTLKKVLDETNRLGAVYRVKMSREVKDKLATPRTGGGSDTPPNANGGGRDTRLEGGLTPSLNKGKKSSWYKRGKKYPREPRKREFHAQGHLWDDLQKRKGQTR